MHRVRFSWRLLSSFGPHSLNDELGSFDPAFGLSNVHRNPALLFPSLGAVALRVAAGLADRVAACQPITLAKSNAVAVLRLRG
jgi:hypothetical protein